MSYPQRCIKCMHFKINQQHLPLKIILAPMVKPVYYFSYKVVLDYFIIIGIMFSWQLHTEKFILK